MIGSHEDVVGRVWRPYPQKQEVVTITRKKRQPTSKSAPKKEIAYLVVV